MNLQMAPTSSGPAERIQLVIDSFPAQLARTQRFTLGVSRSFQISPDGGRVALLRSRGGADPLTCLWVLDVADGRERQ
jgi:dipeptidyl-peptidase 4